MQVTGKGDEATVNGVGSLEKVRAICAQKTDP
jgi:hypothetical protein